MKALVTGGAGFIGSRLAEELVARGGDVRVFDNFSYGHRDAVPAGVEVVEGDLRNVSQVASACEDIEVVFHHAAVKSVPRSMDHPALAHECNATGTLHLLMAAAEAGVRRVIYASSSSVYGGVGNGSNREDTAPHPRSPYAASKLAGEYYSRTWNEIGRLSTVCLRYFNVFGPGQRFDSQYAAVFPGFIEALLTDKRPVIHWDGEQSRDFTFIDDVVRGNVLAAMAGTDVDGKVINLAGGTPHTVNEVFEIIRRVMGVDIEPERAPKRPGDVRDSFADPSRAKDLLGWVPDAEWDEAVARTVEWFRSTR